MMMGGRIAFDTADRRVFLAVALTIALLMLAALAFDRLGSAP